MSAKKRAPGRPPGPAKQGQDIYLVWCVRNAKDKGLTVAEACAQMYLERGRKGDSALQLQRRYERIATAYPDTHVDHSRHGPWPWKRKERVLIGTAMLTWEPKRKPSKY